MNLAHKKTNCLSNIPQRDGTIAHPKAAAGVAHIKRVKTAIAVGVTRYNKTIEDLAKV